MVFGAPPSSTYNPIQELPDLHGKVIIVTGSNGGIGFASMLHLARKGAKVYLAARDNARTADALVKVEHERSVTPEFGEIIFHELDLIDPRSAKNSAERFMERETRLDILINNAALINDGGKPKLNVDGIQDTMATNFLGPFVFTQTLLPLLKATAQLPDSDVRIVNVGSSGHAEVGKLDFNSRAAWNYEFKRALIPSMDRYRYSKLAVHVWTNQLAKRLAADESTKNITVMLVHPGAILSDGAISSLKTLPFPSFWIWFMKSFRLLHPQTKGAYTTVFAAATPKTREEIVSGNYIVTPNVISAQAASALDDGRQRELWEFTEELLKGIEVGFTP